MNVVVRPECLVGGSHDCSDSILLPFRGDIGRWMRLEKPAGV